MFKGERISKKESVFNIYLNFIIYCLLAHIHDFRWNIQHIASRNIVWNPSLSYILDKVFKKGPSKICGRQPLKNRKIKISVGWKSKYVIIFYWSELFTSGFYKMSRSSHRRCSLRKNVRRNFAKFTGKHLRQSLIFSK